MSGCNGELLKYPPIAKFLAVAEKSPNFAKTIKHQKHRNRKSQKNNDSPEKIPVAGFKNSGTQ